MTVGELKKELLLLKDHTRVYIRDGHHFMRKAELKEVDIMSTSLRSGGVTGEVILVGGEPRSPLA